MSDMQIFHINESSGDLYVHKYLLAFITSVDGQFMSYQVTGSRKNLTVIQDDLVSLCGTTHKGMTVINTRDEGGHPVVFHIDPMHIVSMVLKPIEYDESA